MNLLLEKVRQTIYDEICMEFEGSFTVGDGYNFNVNDAEAARAINDWMAGVNKGPYQGRSQMGQIKTLGMSRVSGTNFKVDSEKVGFSPTSLQDVGHVKTEAGVFTKGRRNGKKKK